MRKNRPKEKTKTATTLRAKFLTVRQALRTKMRFIYLADAWEDEERSPKFNALCQDDGGRYYLTTANFQIADNIDPTDLPAQEFHRIDFAKAARWAANAAKYATGGSGTFGPLLEDALKLHAKFRATQKRFNKLSTSAARG